MQEAFLHFIWQFQYFNHSNLISNKGQSIEVLRAGLLNRDAGPDFLGAAIRIDGMAWHGQVEIHCQSSDWYRHGHQKDLAYDSVVLHVVWEDDRPVTRSDGTEIVTLALKDKVQETLLEVWRQMLEGKQSIACASHLTAVLPVKRLAMLDRVLAERLDRKAKEVLGVLQTVGGDWDEVAYRLLAQGMGGRVNQQAFYQLATAVPLKRILQHSDHAVQVEAMFFGQSGLLPSGNAEGYLSVLEREYRFLSSKYKGLSQRQMQAKEWRFGRLRPAGFPTLRIAQLAAILRKNQRVFSKLILLDREDKIISLLSSEVSAYWQQHYHFGKAMKGKVPGMGRQMIERIIINTVVPLLMAYGKFRQQDRYTEQAMGLLERLPAEDNRIVRLWRKMDLPVSNAMDSQAYLELYRQYCTSRQCLNCGIGCSILGKD